uniref:Uncharacterized protein n=1 Tax=Arundo donax TaxID=35708 RepID=A0A0A9EEH8_ARUDO
MPWPRRVAHPGPFTAATRGRRRLSLGLRRRPAR